MKVYLLVDRSKSNPSLSCAQLIEVKSWKSYYGISDTFQILGNFLGWVFGLNFLRREIQSVKDYFFYYFNYIKIIKEITRILIISIFSKKI